MSLVADCSTATTVLVKDGWTLDGKGFTITAVDGPTASFNGAVVQNVGTTMHVKNLKIDGGATTPENCNRVFNGVAFMAAGGSIKGVTLTNIGRPADTGCQLGRAIVVWNTDQHRRFFSAAAVSHDRGQRRLELQQERDRRARPRQRDDHQEHRHRLDEQPRRPERHRRPTGPLRSRRSTATRSAGTTTPRCSTAEATGILVWDASVTIDKKNKLSGNQVDIDIVAGSIGGKYSA